ncbi:MAG: S4 domain-containing protein, partial [Chloroflexota bacterium]
MRVDLIMVEKGLVESRAMAQRLVMAGQVRVAGQVILKSSTKVADDAEITIELGPKYVSRGGDKLAAAIEVFEVNVQDLVCTDVGAST